MRIDAEAQAAFVALSGDANPLHTDPLAARRLPFGRCAVHGMHLALLALDHLVAQTGLAPGRVRATFRRPVGVGDAFELTIDPTVAEQSPTVRIQVDGQTAAEVTVEFADRVTSAEAASVGATRHADADHHPLPRLDPPGTPADLTIDALVARSGTIAVAGDGAAMTHRFAHLAALGPLGVAELLAITRLVGMHVPGLHSMLSSFDVVVTAEPASVQPGVSGRPLPTLAYSVESVDVRFSKVVLQIAGAIVHGTVTAFVRPAPANPIVDTSRVTPDEFTGTRALVVGGSRGLGAAAVQLLAAGGADVRFTYHRGADDAAAVALASPGATAFAYDVEDPDQLARLERIAAAGWRPTLLAWFASPPIFVGTRDRRSPALRDRFHAVYVDAFLAAVARLDPARLDAILWPSSEAVETGVPGLAEYAEAKLAGESACARLAAEHPDLVVHAPRFPRLRTDQTASFVPVEVDAPAPHVLRALRVCAGRQPGRHLH